MPDHSWLSKTRSRLPQEVHEEVFGWVLALIAEHGLVNGERIGVDASTIEANAADHLPILGGRSRDRRRSKDVEFADERPRRKGYRPWRNRAIVYCLIETGMRRAAVCNLDLGEVDFDGRNVTVREKGGQSHRYKISKEGAKAIQDYLREERGADQEMFPQSPALFLPPATVVNSSGR